MTVEQPHWTVYPVNPNNYSNGRGNVYLEAVVWHLAEGSMAGMRSWFNDPRARASTNYGISKSGAIDAYVDLADMAYAHGVVEVAYDTARPLIQANWGINPNLWAASMEFEGTSADVRAGRVPAPQQAEAATWLTAWLFDAILFDPAAGVRPQASRETILMHRDISPNSRVCPTWTESVHAQMIAQVVTRLQPPTPPPPDPQPDPEGPTVEQVQIGLIDKIVHQQWIEAYTDLGKIVGV